MTESQLGLILIAIVAAAGSIVALGGLRSGRQTREILEGLREPAWLIETRHLGLRSLSLPSGDQASSVEMTPDNRALNPMDREHLRRYSRPRQQAFGMVSLADYDSGLATAREEGRREGEQSAQRELESLARYRSLFEAAAKAAAPIASLAAELKLGPDDSLLLVGVPRLVALYRDMSAATGAMLVRAKAEAMKDERASVVAYLRGEQLDSTATAIIEGKHLPITFIAHGNALPAERLGQEPAK